MSFAFGFLYDENMPPSFAQALRDLEPAVPCVCVGEELLLVAAGSFPGEYSDRIVHLPIT